MTSIPYASRLDAMRAVEQAVRRARGRLFRARRNRNKMAGTGTAHQLFATIRRQEAGR